MAVTALVLGLSLAPALARAQDPGVDTNAPFLVSTNSFTFGQAPSWSPDGRHVVYHDDYAAGAGQQVYTANLDGSGRRCITCAVAGPNMVPTYRPQGDVILFHTWQGHSITFGAPGFGGIGSNVAVVRPDGSHRVLLTNDSEGQDNFHAYFSPDGTQIVWTHINCNFVNGDGSCLWDVRLADYVDAGGAPHLANMRIIRPDNGHFYETQWWAPDGSGFLYTESVDSALNLELFFYRLHGPGPQITRLTNNPAWDEQAIFAPDHQNVIFMSTRDHPATFNAFSSLAQTGSLPTASDYLLVLPLFEAGFLQPVGGEATDLYEVNLATLKTRRLTSDGDEGWITPEFAWDPAGERLLWTELRYHSAVRTPIPPNPSGQGQGVLDLAQHPPPPATCNNDPGGQSCLLERRTRIAHFATSGLRPPTSAPTDGGQPQARLGLPANRHCLSRRRLVIHFPRRVLGSTIRSVRVFVAGRLARVLHRHRRAVPINLHGRPRTTVVVRVVATLTGGRRASQRRVYHTCRRRIHRRLRRRR